MIVIFDGTDKGAWGKHLSPPDRPSGGSTLSPERWITAGSLSSERQFYWTDESKVARERGKRRRLIGVKRS